MRVTPEEHRRTEQRVRAAAETLLRGELPPGGKLDITTLARQAGISRATLYRSYPHLKTEFEHQVTTRNVDQGTPDPRDAQVARLKTENDDLKNRITRKDTTINELEQFRTLALSRLAAQHQEIHNLRATVEQAPANIRDLQPRRPTPTAKIIGPC